jgi:hypothetical protein
MLPGGIHFNQGGLCAARAYDIGAGRRRCAAAYRTDFHLTSFATTMSKNRLPQSQSKPAQGPALLGLALDGNDGHTRLTRSKDFVLAGGSEETHSVMRETVIRVTEKLDHRGKSLRDVSPEELRDTFNDVLS